MRMLAFAGRNTKEILRDPLNFAFGLGFPLAVLFLLNAIGVFDIGTVSSGTAVFGTAFMPLFAGMLLAKDRESAFLQRLYAAPMTSADFILGYALPMLPIAVLQNLICYAAAVVCGLGFDLNTVLAIILNIPADLLFIFIGLLCGSVFNSKQVGGICGALITNLTIWLSGAFMPLEMIGGAYEKAAHLLPFYHAVALQREVLSGNFADAPAHTVWVLAYTVPVLALALAAFRIDEKQ